MPYSLQITLLIALISVKELLNSAHFLQSLVVSPQYTLPGHNAMDAFSDEFHFEIKALSESYKPDIDFLSPDVIAFIEELKTNDVHHLEELRTTGGKNHSPN